MTPQDELFHPVVELPEPVRAARYRRLVGLDDAKQQLRQEAILLAAPQRLAEWATEHHGGEPAALGLFRDRAPLFVMGGDVGAGKTALAESFGCDLSDELGVPVWLYRLRLSARGSGLVGEMSKLVGDAFAHLQQLGGKAVGRRGPTAVYVLVVDEADALGQSRAAQQMHHEDRAGVDALLAGVDALAAARVPVLVVMCTNRAGALDPALLRRAAATFAFGRPNEEQRRTVLAAALDGLGLDEGSVAALADATGPHDGGPGFTYSDLTQRLVPTAVLRAFPDRPVTAELLMDVAAGLDATPVFSDGESR